MQTERAEIVGGHLGAAGFRSLVPVDCNTEDGMLYGNVRENTKRDLPMLDSVAAHDGVAVIVGGGPSLSDKLDEVRERYKAGEKIFALNATAAWLRGQGIMPYAQVLLDARESNVRFLKGTPIGTKLYIASQCDPCVFAKAQGHDVTMWHCNYDGKSEVIEHRKTTLLGGGTSVGVMSMVLCEVLGYRTIHLYGMDSSYKQDDGHAYEQPENDGEITVDCVVSGRKFKAALWMVRQAGDFMDVANQLAERGSTIHVHGDGLLPWVALNMYRPQAIGEPKRLLTAIYDLSRSPASFDFFVFACLAEQERRRLKLDGVQMVIAPGLNEGFREDVIPPTDPEHRKQMLWGIVMSGARLVRGLASLTLCNTRHEISPLIGEHRFPSAYSVEYPQTAFGFMPMVQGMAIGDLRFLKAPPRLVELVREWVPANAVTITLRETHYGEYRNSDLTLWTEAARKLEAAGYSVVFVRDIEHAHEPLDGFQVCREASYDIGMRAALYEGAGVNLFVANGPACISYLNPKCRTLMFGMISSDEAHMSKAGWTHKGFDEGSQFPNAQGCKLVWDDETTADVIVRETLEMLK